MTVCTRVGIAVTSKTHHVALLVCLYFKFSPLGRPCIKLHCTIFTFLGVDCALPPLRRHLTSLNTAVKNGRRCRPATAISSSTSRATCRPTREINSARYHPQRLVIIFGFEPERNKTYKKTCASSKDSDQPKPSLGLIRLRGCTC